MEHITVSRETFDSLTKTVHKKDLKELTFELVVGSCFPNIMNNIKEEMRKQYTKGYIDGQNNKDND